MADDPAKNNTDDEDIEIEEYDPAESYNQSSDTLQEQPQTETPVEEAPVETPKRRAPTSYEAADAVFRGLGDIKRTLFGGKPKKADPVLNTPQEISKTDITSEPESVPISTPVNAPVSAPEPTTGTYTPEVSTIPPTTPNEKKLTKAEKKALHRAEWEAEKAAAAAAKKAASGGTSTETPTEETVDTTETTETVEPEATKSGKTSFLKRAASGIADALRGDDTDTYGLIASGAAANAGTVTNADGSVTKTTISKGFVTVTTTKDGKVISKTVTPQYLNSQSTGVPVAGAGKYVNGRYYPTSTVPSSLRGVLANMRATGDESIRVARSRSLQTSKNMHLARMDEQDRSAMLKGSFNGGTGSAIRGGNSRSSPSVASKANPADALSKRGMNSPSVGSKANPADVLAKKQVFSGNNGSFGRYGGGAPVNSPSISNKTNPADVLAKRPATNFGGNNTFGGNYGMANRGGYGGYNSYGNNNSYGNQYGGFNTQPAGGNVLGDRRPPQGNIVRGNQVPFAGNVLGQKEKQDIGGVVQRKQPNMNVKSQGNADHVKRQPVSTQLKSPQPNVNVKTMSQRGGDHATLLGSKNRNPAERNTGTAFKPPVNGGGLTPNHAGMKAQEPITSDFGTGSRFSKLRPMAEESQYKGKIRFSDVREEVENDE